MNESFVFYKSFADAIENLPAEQYKAIVVALTTYALNGEEPDLSDPYVKALFTLMKPQVDANNRKREAGRKGGEQNQANPKLNEANPKQNEAKGKQNEANPKQNQANPKQNEANVNVNANVNANDNENANVNANANENVNANVSPSGEKEKTDSIESVQKKRFTIEDALIGLGFSTELETALKEWCSYKSERHETYKDLGLKSLVTQVSNNAKQYGDLAVIRAIRDSMASGYKGIMFDRLRAAPKTGLTHDEFVDQWRNV